MLRRRLLGGIDGTDPSKAAPLEVAFYNGRKIVIREESKWKDGEIPIGIVVVPGYHNRYNDGTCGIMSLVGMHDMYPETGRIVSGSQQTDNRSMIWGHYPNNVGNSIFSSTVANGRNNVLQIPYQASADSTATSANLQYIQWPYDGTSTSLTSAKSETSDVVVPSMNATSGHVFGDFNGIKNTAACYVATKSNSQWTDSMVSTQDINNGTPAAACAGRFKTVGTKSFYDVYSGITSGNANYGTSGDTHNYKGMWYLPSLGELCYLPSKQFEINKTILALNRKYGNVGVQLETGGRYWSSSEHGGDSAWCQYMSGFVQPLIKYNNYNVRAFMRL